MINFERNVQLVDQPSVYFNLIKIPEKIETNMLTVEKIIGDLHLTEMKIDSKSAEYLIIFLCGEETTMNIKIIYYKISQGGRPCSI